MQETNRRTFLLASGSTVATLALAGCGQPYREGRDPENLYADGEGDSGGGGDDGNGGGSVPEGVPEEVHSYLSEANDYDGTVEDMTGQDSVTVENGTNEPQYAFGPPAVRVSTGTTVTWEWVADVAHSVTDEDGAFDSGIQSSASSTFEHTFEEAGNYLYYCTPHRSIGQLGAVIVE